MTPWAISTWMAVAVLVTVPVVVLVMFLRDAVRMFKQFGDSGESNRKDIAT